jgi:hypothetical protein
MLRYISVKGLQFIHCIQLPQICKLSESQSLYNTSYSFVGWVNKLIMIWKWMYKTDIVSQIEYNPGIGRKRLNKVTRTFTTVGVWAELCISNSSNDLQSVRLHL